MSLDPCCAVRKYACTIGDGVSVSFALVHNLDTMAPIVDIYDSEGRMVLAIVEVLGPHTVLIKPSVVVGERPRYWTVWGRRIRRPFAKEFYTLPPVAPDPDSLVVVISG